MKPFATVHVCVSAVSGEVEAKWQVSEVGTRFCRRFYGRPNEPLGPEIVCIVLWEIAAAGHGMMGICVLH